MAGKQPYELWGEAIREIGLLLFVFAPLDALFKRDYGNSTDWLIAGCVAVAGLILIWVGIVLEAET